MYSLVDQPVMHVLLATRQRVYSSQAYSHRHTERSNLLRSRVYLFINFYRTYSLFTLTYYFFRYTPFASLSRYNILLIGKPLPNHATIAWFFFISKRLRNLIKIPKSLYNYYSFFPCSFAISSISWLKGRT